jgi:NADPH-dependent 2,4-dienoyl-CoA reductase/sulfur reductase-like enzyme
MAKKRVVVVGGVAGGATCAARLRRLDEEAEIVILERGPYVSFANCGLPYYVGNVIQGRVQALAGLASIVPRTIQHGSAHAKRSSRD